MSSPSSRLASWQSRLMAAVISLARISRMSDLELLGQLAHGRRGPVQSGRLLGRQCDLDDLLDSPAPELDRHPDEQPADPVLALQVGRAGQDLLLVAQDRLHYLGDRRARGVEGAPRLQQVDDLGA